MMWLAIGLTVFAALYGAGVALAVLGVICGSGIALGRFALWWEARRCRSLLRSYGVTTL